MSLVLREQGSPVEVAVRFGIANGIISPSRLAELHQELCGIVEGATVKFVGFVAAKSVKRGLDLTLGLLSLGLSHETKGAHHPEAWAKAVAAMGFKAIAAKVVGLFKELAAMPADDLGAADGLASVDAKELILTCFAVRHRKPVGYAWYEAERLARTQNVQFLRLFNFLVFQFIPGGEGEWKRAQRESVPTEGGVPFAGSVVNAAFLRAALGHKPGLGLTYDQFMAGQRALKKGGRVWMEGAEARFNAFARRLPREYRETYAVKTWFKVHFEGSFRHAFGKSRGISFFHVTLVPDSVQQKMERASDWKKAIPKESRYPMSE